MLNFSEKMTFFLAFIFRTGQKSIGVVERQSYALPPVSDKKTNVIVSVRTEFTALDV